MTDQFQKGAGSGWRVGFANVSFIFVERAQSGPRFFLFAGHMNRDLAELTTEIKNRVERLGFELVDLRKKGSKSRPVIEARIDRPDSTPGDGVSSQDCVIVSRGLEAWLDETQLMGPKYVLEVSSPGIERPIRWPEHWRRFTGKDVQVKVANVGRMRATIVDVIDDTRVVLRPQGSEEPIEVALHDVKDATLAFDWDS